MLGRIRPSTESTPPPWVAGNRFPLARLALAFRRELFVKVGNFDTARGMQGNKLVRGEEVELISPALGQGARVAYDPSVAVLNRIDHDRPKKRYFLER